MSNATTDRTFRLGDRVRLRVGSHADDWGDVIGIGPFINNKPDDRICVGWNDGSQSWENPIELRLETER